MDTGRFNTYSTSKSGYCSGCIDDSLYNDKDFIERASESQICTTGVSDDSKLFDPVLDVGKIVLVKLQRPHTTSPQNLAKEGKSPYFREIYVGEILQFPGNPACPEDSS